MRLCHNATKWAGPTKSLFSDRQQDISANLCFLTVDNRFEYNKRNLFFLVDQSKVEQIPALGGGFETIDLMISPSRHYAAVIEDSGEGHGIFFVTALDRVRKQLGVRRCPGIEAYPHGFLTLAGKRMPCTLRPLPICSLLQKVRSMTSHIYRFIIIACSRVRTAGWKLSTKAPFFSFDIADPDHSSNLFAN